ncbi:MAG TPA: hypothetical protein VGG39_12530 [Polyangiaceae bacterium]
MSYNLAVWEGSLSTTDGDAALEFDRLFARYMEGDAKEPPSQAIAAFVAAITSEYPDIVDLPDEKVDDGVWSDGPLLDDASGPLFYFGVVGSFVEDVVPFVTRVAAEQGLVCFDPQEGKRLRVE